METKETYRLVRGKRKTVSVRVCPDGSVEVRAPRWFGRAQIEAFLLQKQAWIAAQQARMRELERRRREFSAAPGSLLPLLGRSRPVAEGNRAHFDGECFRICPDRPGKPQLIGIYRELARADLERRVDRFAPLVGVRPAGMRITSARTRFGSCSGSNRLSFPWMLVMADGALIDYVVVHELCHILEHNHSERFWKEVERVLPDYRRRQLCLRGFAEMLQEQDWS